MKTKRYIRVFLSLLLVLTLAACGVPAEDFQALSEAHVQLEGETSSLQQEVERLQSQLGEAESERSRLEVQSEEQESKSGQLQQENDTLHSEVEKLEGELAVKYQTQAQPVMDSIASIGDVTLEKEEAITAARRLYQELPDPVKQHVANAGTLTAAETALQEQKDQKAEQERIAREAEQERIAQQEREASEAAAQAEKDASGDQVMVTPTGSKYHLYKCGNGTYTWTSLSSALACGLTPRKKCF